jgi:hypothetical protein
MINEVLDFSKIEAGKLSSDRRPSACPACYAISKVPSPLALPRSN